MFHARLQVFHVRRGKRVLIQTVHSRVDLLHGAAEVVYQRTALACEVVDAGFACASDVGIWRAR